MKPDRISHQNGKSIYSNSKNPIENKINNLWQAVTECTAVLLNDEDFDRGVSKALEILGTSIGADRVGIGEQHDDPTGETLGYITVDSYEWLSSDTVSQVSHSELSRINSKEFGEDHFKLLSGNHVGGSIENYPEPFRSGQQKLGVKAVYAIPIMVRGEYRGILGLDFCRTARELCEAEINLLKTAATCIGSAIQRERNRQAREQAERTALLERQKTEELQQRDRLLNITAQAVQALLNDENLKSAIDRALDIIGQGIDTDRVCVMEHHGDPTGNSLGVLKILYEWISAYAVSQSQHPQLHTISYEGLEDWYEQLSQGEAVGGDIDELPEAVREGQKELGVKTMYAVPIIVDGDYWGIIGFDHCREVRLRSESEISILKATAACIGSAIEQNRIRQARERAERTALLEQQKATQLAEHNLVLEQRDKILAATAEASNVLLTGADFDEAVNTALQIIGETIDTDSIGVLENWNDPSKQSVVYWRTVYEWISPGTISQLSHPDLTRGSYEGIEEWYELLSEGQCIVRRLAEMPEPFRSGQKKLGVKVLYAVPIFVEGKFWGVAAFDDCREETHRSEAELSILKTAAACIGSAIQQERIRRAKEAAERNILLEREKAAIEKAEQLRESNLVLSLRDRWLEATANAANKLLENADLDAGINTALKVLGESLDCDRVDVMQHIEDDTEKYPGYVRLLYEWNSIYATPQMLHPQLYQATWHEDWLIAAKAGEFTGGTIDELDEPCRSEQSEVGVKSLYNAPIFVNNRFWGIVGIDFCREARRLTLPEIAVFKTAASCIGSAIYRQLKDEALKKSEKRYRTLFELSNEGIYRFEFDEPISTSLSVEEQLQLTYQHYRIAEVNDTFVEQYGFGSIDEVVGKKLTEFYPQDSEISRESIRTVIENGYQVSNLETEEIDADGKLRYFLHNMVSDVRDGYAHGGWGMQTDITELKQVQQDLLEAERQQVAQLEESNLVLSLRDRWLEATANAANKLLENADLDTGINTALKVLGESLDCDRVCIGQHFEDNTRATLGHLRLLYEWNSVYVDRQINSGFIEFPWDELDDWFALVKMGEWVGGIVEELSEPFRSGQIELGVKSLYNVPIFINNQLWGILCIDFCRQARKLTEPEIAVFKTAASCIGSAIYRQQIQAEKERAELAILEERNRMAREIHDTLAQAFTGITLQLEVARSSLTAESNAVAERLLKAKSLAQEGIKEARRSVRALRPEVLDSGLAIAIHQLVDKMLSGTDLESEVSITGEPNKLTSDIEIELFRIVQEAVTNTVRHAQASKIFVELVSDVDGVQLKIEDNGIGFDSQLLLNEGFGLIGMRERSDRLEGNIEINSAIGKGTKITVAIAL